MVWLLHSDSSGDGDYYHMTLTVRVSYSDLPLKCNKTVCVCTGVSALLVESLFSEMQQPRLAVEVHSVYVTAFQIVNESIQDLLQTQNPSADPAQRHLHGELANTSVHILVLSDSTRIVLSC